jgi:hypothetical protein
MLLLVEEDITTSEKIRQGSYSDMGGGAIRLETLSFISVISASNLKTLFPNGDSSAAEDVNDGWQS